MFGFQAFYNSPLSLWAGKFSSSVVQKNGRKRTSCRCNFFIVFVNYLFPALYSFFCYSKFICIFVILFIPRLSSKSSCSLFNIVFIWFWGFSFFRLSCICAGSPTFTIFLGFYY